MDQMIYIADYEATVGRKPRGYGVWRFEIGASIYHHTGTFARAAKSAIAMALSRNEKSISSCPRRLWLIVMWPNPVGGSPAFYQVS